MKKKKKLDHFAKVANERRGDARAYVITINVCVDSEPPMYDMTYDGAGANLPYTDQTMRQIIIIIIIT